MIGVLASGAGSNLRALLEAGLPVRAVASNVDDAAALDLARAAGLETAVFSLEDYTHRASRDAAMAGWFEGHGVQLIVCAGYMHLLTSGFLARFPDRVVNVHPALLPCFPGTHAVADAIAAGVTVTGATVHLVDEGVDTGTVLRQEAVPVLPGDTAVTLHERIRVVEHRLLPEVVKELVAR